MNISYDTAFPILCIFACFMRVNAAVIPEQVREPPPAYPVQNARITQTQPLLHIILYTHRPTNCGPTPNGRIKLICLRMVVIRKQHYNDTYKIDLNCATLGRNGHKTPQLHPQLYFHCFLSFCIYSMTLKRQRHHFKGGKLKFITKTIFTRI